MKNHLLTLLTLTIITFSSCSKDKESHNENISLGDDALVSKLGLKIEDKTNLTISKQIFTSSNGSVLIIGTQNAKYWLGLFDKSGKQITVKRYDADPETFIGTGGRIIKPTYNHFYKDVIEFDNKIFITRQLREDNNLIASYGGFVEDLTKIDLSTGTISTNYSTVAYGGNVPFTSFVGPWMNDHILLTKMMTDDRGFTRTTEHIVYDLNYQEKFKFSNVKPSSIFYTVISDHILINLDNLEDGNSVPTKFYLTANDIVTGKKNYSTLVFENINRFSTIKILKTEIIGISLTIVFEITDPNKVITTKTVKTNLNNGLIVN